MEDEEADMMSRQIRNITCPKCSAPLIAFEHVPGKGLSMHAYEAAIRRDDSTPETLYAVCAKCGGESPFPRAWLLGP